MGNVKMITRYRTFDIKINDSEQISSAARYLRCEELDILEAIDTPEKVIETTTVIKTMGDI